MSDGGSVLIVAAGYDDQAIYTYDLIGGFYSVKNVLFVGGYMGPMSVSLSGNGLIMALGFSDKPTTAGSVRIYAWSGTTWVLRGVALVPADAALADGFGKSVWLSSDGTHLFVGAPGWEGTQTNQGGVYEFYWDGATWTQVGGVITTNVASGALGWDISLSNDRTILAVSSPDYNSSRGRVQIFVYNGSLWSLRDTITASDSATSDYFGSGLAINKDGTALYVGARGWEGTAPAVGGGVYTYTYNGSAWAQLGAVQESPIKIDTAAHTYADYGTALNISADYSKIGIGATGYSYQKAPFAVIGDVYSYEISGTVVDDANAPVQRNITAHLEATGECVNSVASATDGTYSIAVPKTGKYFLVCQDDTGGTSYNALVYSGIEVV